MVHEIIHKLNGPDEAYLCRELHREPGYAVLAYDVPHDAHIGAVTIPAGSLTLAHYRADCGFVLWEMYGPERALIGYCYHLCTPPTIGPDFVEYLDLLLDLWFAPDGTLTVLDEDELEEAVAAGKVGDDEQRLIAREREAIPLTHTHTLAALWRPPAPL